MWGPMMSGSDNRSCRDAGSPNDAERLSDAECFSDAGRLSNGASFRYSGQELPQMARAVHWKSYIAELVRPHLGAAVLEVGAGIGSNIPYLRHPPVREWTAVEPDAAQAAQIREPGVRVVAGTIAAIGATERFDTILYLDVLEHLADDAAELRRAATHLVPGGRLVVLSPAHRWLTSPMDAAVGHYRRYSAAGLRALTPVGCRLEVLDHLDAFGCVASLANRLVLRRTQISAGQVRLWDGGLVPLSRRLDRWLGFRFGKSLLAVWRAVGAEQGGID
ncbi:MAG TPA: class I SAM-dependent methyltransferase [Acetobacteraceae bacterium]|nr:class I SAM-dependent methyltransferase [Acetobacteraceae bacterium]